MTCIVSCETKKELKQAISEDRDLSIEDPSIMNPRCFSLSEIQEGEKVYVTNHPKRSWFAQISRLNGKLAIK